MEPIVLSALTHSTNDEYQESAVLLAPLVVVVFLDRSKPIQSHPTFRFECSQLFYVKLWSQVKQNASSAHHQRIIRASSLHDQCIISASSAHHQRIISAWSMHLMSIISASTVHDQRIISTWSVHDQCINSASTVDQQCIIRASPEHHQCIISASSVHHQCMITGSDMTIAPFF